LQRHYIVLVFVSFAVLLEPSSPESI
jgi:hypothetical protein